MALTLTITHPDGSVSAAVTPVSVSGPLRKFNAAAMLSCTIAELYSLLSDSTNAANPLRKGSMVVLVRNGVTLFKGYVYEITPQEAQGGVQTIQLSCKDRMGKWELTLAGVSGIPQFTAECATSALGYESNAVTINGGTQIELAPLDQTDGYDDTVASWPTYPKFNSATDTPSSASPWIAKSKMPATSLLANIDDTSTAAIAIADYTVLTCPGFVQIGTELIQYEFTYAVHPASGTHGYIANLTRGALGSTAASHTAGDAVTQRVRKTISQRVPVRVFNGSDDVDPGDYQTMISDGRFDFGYDPAGLTNLKGSYGVYDEDASDGLSVASLATAILEYDRASGGAGLSSGQIDVTGLDFIPVSRYQVGSAQTTLDTLRALADQAGLDRRGFGAKPIGMYYDSSTDKATLLSLTQKGTADMTLRSARDMTEQIPLAGLYSGVCVTYSSDSPSQLATLTRMWHPKPGDQFNTDGSPNDTYVAAIIYSGQNRSVADDNYLSDLTATHNSPHLRNIVDGRKDTGWGLLMDGPDTAFDDEDPAAVLYAWFGNSAAVISAIYIVIDMRGFVPGGFTLLDVVGLDAYTPGDPPTVGNVIQLADALRYIISGGGDLNSHGPQQRWIMGPQGPEAQ